MQPRRLIACVALAIAPITAFSTPTPLSLAALINNKEIPDEGCEVLGVEGFHPFILTNVDEGEAADGELKIFGVEFNIISAHVIPDYLLVEGMLEISPPIPVPGTTNTTIQGRAATLRFDRQGFDTISGGTICFENDEDGILELGKKVKLIELCPTIEVTERRIGGSGVLEWELGKGKNPCNPTEGRTLQTGVGVVFKGGTLERIELELDELMKPLGSTGAFLNTVSGAFGFEDDLWYIEAGMIINVGCKIPGTDIYPATMYADGKITSAWFIEITGMSEIFGVPTSEARLLYSPPLNILVQAKVDFFDAYISECELQLNGTDFSGEALGLLQIPDHVPFVGGWKVANTRAAVDNESLRGSFTLNVSPEIPPICTDSYCPPRVPYWKWYRWRGWRKRYWQPPCTPAFCTPRIPPVTARVAFEFHGDTGFSWEANGVSEPETASWQLAHNHVFVDPASGARMRFMSNYSRGEKMPAPEVVMDGGVMIPNPFHYFSITNFEQNVILCLNYSNTNAPADLNLTLPSGETVHITEGPLPHGFPNGISGLTPGAFSEVAIRGDTNTWHKEAYFSLPVPELGEYTIMVANAAELGEHEVFLLRENLAPIVSLDGISEAGSNITVNFTTDIEGDADARIYLCKAGRDGEAMSGVRYMMMETNILSGSYSFDIPANSTNVSSGLFQVAVRIDDPDSVIVEALSEMEVLVQNPNAPDPVSEFVTLARYGGFDIAWIPSLETNIAAYVIRYTEGHQPVDFEHQQTVSYTKNRARVDGLVNGRPYLVTIVAVNTEGYQSPIAPVTRVVPTEGYGLSLPAIASPAHQAVAADQLYVHKPQSFWADADINQLLAKTQMPIDVDEYIKELITLFSAAPLSGTTNIPAVVFSSIGIDPAESTNLVEALFATLPLEWNLAAPPIGMEIDSNGMITWTPTVDDIGEHLITVRATITNDLPGALPEPYVTDTYSLTVVAAKQANTCGAKPSARTVLANPTTRAVPEGLYACAPILDFEEYYLELLQGPPGMTVEIVPDPRTLQVVYHPVGSTPPLYLPEYELTYTPLELLYWEVPANAENQRVQIRAVPRDIAEPLPSDCLYQDFLLTVSSPPTLAIVPELAFNTLEFTDEGVGMTWLGEGSDYRVERSVDLKTWTEVGTSFGIDFPALPAELNLPMGFGMFLDESPSPSNAFYRIKTY